MALPPAEMQYQTDHINENRTPGFIASVSVVCSLATIAVGLRLTARAWTKVGMGMDDYLICIALLIVWGMFVGNIYEGRDGLGKHELASTLPQLISFAKILWFEDMAYATATLMVQASFLTFYRRIFTLENLRFRVALYAVSVFAFLCWVSIFFATLFNCTPIAYNWDKSINGSCINPQALFLSGLAINLFTDICIVLLPIPMVWQIQINRTEKFAVSGAFILGGFCCVGNLIRLPYLINVDQYDLTWSLLKGELWGTAEVCVAIIAACLPCYRPFLRSIKRTLKSYSGSNRSGSRSATRSGSEKIGLKNSLSAPRHRWDTLPRDGQPIGVQSEVHSSQLENGQNVDLEDMKQEINVQRDLHMTSNK